MSDLRSAQNVRLRSTRGVTSATPVERERLTRLRRRMPVGAVAGRRTAAFLHGIHLDMPGEQDRPVALQVLRSPGLEPMAAHLAGIEGFTATLDGDRDEVLGIPVTSLERTLLDVARFESPLLGLATLDHALRDGLFDPADLLERAQAFRGERWVARARDLVRWADPGAESPGESWTRLRILQAGLPRPETQVRVDRDDGRSWWLDLGYRDAGVAIEYDGFAFHVGRRPVERDSRRRAELVRRGWTIFTVGAGDVLGRSTALEEGLVEALGLSRTVPPRRC